MKSVKALLFVMVFSLSVLAGCTSTPTEAPTDDTTTTKVTVPATDIVVPTTDTDTSVTDEATEAAGNTDTTGATTGTTGATVEKAADTGVTTPDASGAVTGGKTE